MKSLAVIAILVAGAFFNGKVNADWVNNEMVSQAAADDKEVGTDREESEMDEANRTIIAKALGIEENSRNIRFILNSLNTIEAGQIQDAELTEENGDRVLALTAEDGTKYQLYLSASGNVEAVKNLTTGEWPIQSMQ